jgi:hypothetical protein
MLAVCAARNRIAHIDFLILDTFVDTQYVMQLSSLAAAKQRKSAPPQTFQLHNCSARQGVRTRCNCSAATRSGQAPAPSAWMAPKAAPRVRVLRVGDTRHHAAAGADWRVAFAIQPHQGRCSAGIKSPGHTTQPRPTLQVSTRAHAPKRRVLTALLHMCKNNRPPLPGHNVQSTGRPRGRGQCTAASWTQDSF